MTKAKYRFIFRALMLSFCTIPLALQAALISGKVTDDKNHPLPYANVYIKGTSLGTATNFQGYFQLKLDPGKYEIIFQYIGYRKHSELITLAEKNLNLQIKLIPEEITLSTVTIKAEDPSYAIIRKAIEKKDFYMKQVKTYTCKVFAKSLFRLTDAPKKILGEEILDKGDTLGGIFYLSESESEISFQQPDRVREVMVSSKVSGSDKGFSFNFYSFFMISFYKNLVNPPMSNGRGFVTPLSDNAFLYYKFKLEGSFIEGDHKIYKIKVIPKRMNDPVFSGYIYIVDKDYRIHSVDLKLPKEAKINFVDSLKISQQYVPVSDSEWMVLSQKIHFFFSIDFLGKKFGGNGIFNSQNTDYRVNISFPKDYFGSEYVRIQPTANKKDSAYWAANRPIPLTEEEQKNYRKMDSVARKHNTREYQDSIQKKENKLRWGILYNGYNYRNRYDSVVYSFPSPLSTLLFNTVQGWNARLSFTSDKTFNERKHFRTDISAGYGFSDKTFRGEAGSSLSLNPDHFGSLGINVGIRSISQFDPHNPITPFVNSLYSILTEENFMKMYEKSFINIQKRSEIFNGFMLTTNLEYAYSNSLSNHFSSPVTDVSNRRFTSNIPDFRSFDGSFEALHSAYLTLSGSYTISQRYAYLPYKMTLGSKYPRIGFFYKRGYYLVNEWKTGFDFLRFDISDKMSLGLLGQFRYQVQYGSFLGTHPFFIDFKHFNGNRTIFGKNDFTAFQVMDYYTFSTGTSFWDAHLEHHFNGWLFNKLPLLNKTKLREIAGFQYLHNDIISDYWEFNFGIENLFTVLRLDYVISFNGSKYMRDGICLRLPFGN